MPLLTDGPFSPTVIALSGSPTPSASGWQNPSGILLSDSNYATTFFSGVYPTQESDTILLTGFGFSIPSGVTVTGVRVRTQRWYNVNPIMFGPNIIADKKFQLLYNGDVIGADRSQQWEFSPSPISTIYDYGSETDTWSVNLTKSQVSSSTFGIAIQTFRSGDPTVLGSGYQLEGYLNSVRMEVFYAQSGNLENNNPLYLRGHIADSGGTALYIGGANVLPSSVTVITSGTGASNAIVFRSQPTDYRKTPNDARKDGLGENLVGCWLMQDRMGAQGGAYRIRDRSGHNNFLRDCAELQSTDEARDPLWIAPVSGYGFVQSQQYGNHFRSNLQYNAKVFRYVSHGIAFDFTSQFFFSRTQDIDLTNPNKKFSLAFMIRANGGFLRICGNQKRPNLFFGSQHPGIAVYSNGANDSVSVNWNTSSNVDHTFTTSPNFLKNGSWNVVVVSVEPRPDISSLTFLATISANGKTEAGLVTIGDSTPYTGSLKSFLVGANGLMGATDGLQTELGWFCFWNRTLSSREAQTLTEDAYLTNLFQNKRYYPTVAASGGTTTTTYPTYTTLYMSGLGVANNSIPLFTTSPPSFTVGDSPLFTSGPVTIASGLTLFTDGIDPHPSSFIFPRECTTTLNAEDRRASAIYTSGTGAEWYLPDYANSNDALYTFSVVSSGQSTQYLLLQNFTFNIPSDRPINGVEFRVERAQNYNYANSYIIDEDVKLISSGGFLGPINKASGATWQYYALGDETMVYGGQDDLWGDVLSPAVVNDPRFGLAFKVRNPGSGSAPNIPGIDQVICRIYWVSTSGSACNNLTLYLKSEPSSGIPLYLEADVQIPFSGSLPLYLHNPIFTHSSGTPLFTQSFSPLSSGGQQGAGYIPLFMSGAVGTPSDGITLFLQGPDRSPFSGTMNLYMSGRYSVLSNSAPMVVYNSYVGQTAPLFTRGRTLDYDPGYGSTQENLQYSGGSLNLYIERTLAVQAGVSMFVGYGIDYPEFPLFMQASVPYGSGLTLFMTNPTDTISKGARLYVRGAS